MFKISSITKLADNIQRIFSNAFIIVLYKIRVGIDIFFCNLLVNFQSINKSFGLWIIESFLKELVQGDYFYW